MQCTVNFTLCFTVCFNDEFVYNIQAKFGNQSFNGFIIYSFGKTRYNTTENTLSEKTTNTKLRILSDAIKRLPSQEHYYEISGN